MGACDCCTAIADDLDSEIITATAVTAGNAGDAVAAETLLSDILPAPNASTEAPISSSEALASNPVDASPAPEVYGDASYGTEALIEKLEAANVEANLKVRPPSARAGKFSQDDFRIDLDAQNVQRPGVESFDCGCSKTAPAKRNSDPHANSARCARSARTASTVAPSTSIPSIACSTEPAADNATRSGRNAIGPPVPRWSGKSPT